MNMGIGKLGNSNIIFKRKFRWTFSVDNICGGGSIPEHYVKSAARPNLSIEETEINYLNAKMYIPGKATWENITITYYDVAGSSEMQPLYNWLASVYDFAHPDTLKMGSNARDYGGTGHIKLYDGCGGLVEEWVLGQAWPQAINFGELDYSSTEEVTIELTLRYTEVQYLPSCGLSTPVSCCTGCS